MDCTVSTVQDTADFALTLNGTPLRVSGQSDYMRVAFLGDVHGQIDALVDSLEGLGVDIGRVWPDDLVVCQLGDQIDGGPHSQQVLALRQTLLEWDAARWVDLWGNHEAPYVGMAPHYAHRADLPAEVAQRITDDTWRLFALGVRTGSGRQILATHGGVTFEWWQRYCAGSGDVAEMAGCANRLWSLRASACATTGIMIDPRQRPNLLVSPLWAHAGYEVAASWEGRHPPFDQVVGHSGLVWWGSVDGDGGGRDTHDSAHPVHHDHSRRHSTLTFGNGATLTVIDPHAERSDTPLVPLVVADVAAVWGAGLLWSVDRVEGRT